MDTTARQGPRLALLAFAMLIVAVDFNIVYVALPEIGNRLGFSAQSLQWVVSAYAVGFGGFLLLGGRMVDRLGPRRMFMLALMIYAVSSLVGGLATEAGVLVGARFVQGVGGALLFPATLALIHRNFAEGPERNRAMAVWGTASASGLIVGAGAGGLLTFAFGWQWVFFVNIPLALGAVLATPALLAPDGRRGRGGGFDLPGTLLASASATLLVFGLVSGPEAGWGSVRGAGALVAGLVLLGVFLLVERRVTDPVLPLRMFGNRSLVMAMVLVVVFMTAINGLHYVYFIYLQDILGFDALRAGLAFLPISIGGMVGSGKVLPVLLRRSGLRTTFFLGLLGIGVSMLLIAPFMAVGGSFWALVPAALLWGLSAGLAFSSVFLSAGAGVASGEQGVASAMASTTQQIGGALGLAVLVAVANAGADLSGVTDPSPDVVVTGLRNAIWVGAVLTVLGSFLAFLVPKSASDKVAEDAAPDDAAPDDGADGVAENDMAVPGRAQEVAERES